MATLIQARNVQFKPIADYRPEYEERILLVCENPKITEKSAYKKAAPTASRIIRVGQLMHTGKQGHVFKFEDERSGDVGLGLYAKVVAWAQIPELTAFDQLPETDEDEE